MGGKCEWKETDEFWETECGKAWELTEGTPFDNKMNFCPFCGVRIMVAEEREGGSVMKNPYEITREYFPGKPDDFLGFVIWEKTGWPSFWNIPTDGKTPEECFRKQLQEAKEKS